MLSIQSLREKRTALAKQAKNLLDQAGEDFGNPAKDDRKNDKATIDDLYAQIDRIDAQIAAIERSERLDAENANPASATRKADDDATLTDRDAQVFDRWLRNGMSAMSAEDMEHIRSRPKGDQSSQDGTKGGYTAPGDFNATLLERLKAYGGVREACRQISTSTGNDITWPTTDETSQEGEIVNESQAANDSDLAFGTVAIRAHRYSSKIIAVPTELLQDTKIDLVGFITRALGVRIARIQNRHFTVGSGINQPRGFVTVAATGKTTASGQTTSLIYEDFVDMEHSIDPAYRAGGSCKWQFHDNILKAVKKLKDSTGRPLWVPGLSSKEPDTLLKYPYVINQHMADTIQASAKTMAFGDFDKYLVRDVMGVTLLRFDDSVYAKKGQVGFLCFARADGNVVDALDDSGQSGAFKVLVQAAS